MTSTAGEATTTRRGICCHCGARCGILVEVDPRGEPVAVKGDPTHPMSKGFLCTRGQAAIEYLDDPTRLNVPLKRVGQRGAGRWQEVAWDEALDDIASRLLAIRDASGPEAVAYL